MQRTTLSGIFFGLLLFGIGGLLQASEADELRERAEAMQDEARALTEKGYVAEAERLGDEAVRMLEVAEQLDSKVNGRFGQPDRPSFEAEFRELRERHQGLLAKQQAMREANVPEEEFAEVRKLIGETRRQLEIIHAHQSGRSEDSADYVQAERFENAGRRIHHLRVAAENLVQAEEHDLARKLKEQAASMEQELIQAEVEQTIQAAKERAAAKIHESQKHQKKDEPDWVYQLREEIKQLRAEVKELREKVIEHEGRPNFPPDR